MNTNPTTSAAHNAPQVGFSDFKPPIWQSEAIQMAVKKILSSRNLAIENLTEKQVGDAIAQAISCGDFIRHVRVSDDAQSILLLGASGNIGSAFAAELHRRKIKFESPPRRWVDYTKFDVLLNYLKTLKPEFVINCAGFTGKPNVDACEKNKPATLAGNVHLPIRIAHACATLGIPWLHVSSGCIFNGPGPFSENNLPNFTFDHPPCSFYSGSKALAEDCISTFGQVYICRLRLPFDEFDGPRNYLSKLQRYSKVYEATNSISHRGDFVKAALDLWEKKAPFGIYNMTNPGYVTTRQVVMMMHTILRLDREWEFFENDAEFYSTAAIAPRSNCVLSTVKLAGAGVTIRPVEQAVADALHHWRAETIKE